jgi:hypothetical protein
LRLGSSSASRRNFKTLYRKLAGSRNPPSAFGNIGASEDGSGHSNFHCLSSVQGGHSALFAGYCLKSSGTTVQYFLPISPKTCRSLATLRFLATLKCLIDTSDSRKNHRDRTRLSTALALGLWDRLKPVEHQGHVRFPEFRPGWSSRLFPDPMTLQRGGSRHLYRLVIWLSRKSEQGFAALIDEAGDVSEEYVIDSTRSDC